MDKDSKRTFKILKLTVDRCRLNIKLQKERIKGAEGTDKETYCKTYLKTLETKLATAEQELKDFSIAQTKNAINWLAVGITGLITLGASYLVYDKFGSPTETPEPTKDRV